LVCCANLKSKSSAAVKRKIAHKDGAKRIATIIFVRQSIFSFNHPPFGVIDFHAPPIDYFRRKDVIKAALEWETTE